MSRYPDTPGSKGPDGTSEDAAILHGPHTRHLRRTAMIALCRLGEATTLEAVAIAGVSREALQPRFSELRAMGLVESTGRLRINPSGKVSAVLRLTEAGGQPF